MFSLSFPLSLSLVRNYGRGKAWVEGTRGACNEPPRADYGEE